MQRKPMMPTDEQIAAMGKNAERLKKLSDDELIMLALSELVSVNDAIPVGKRIPLQSALENRAGTRTTIDQIKQADG